MIGSIPLASRLVRVSRTITHAGRHHSLGLDVFRSNPRVQQGRHQSTVSPPFAEPLRILFAGSDNFSIHSLRALHGLLRHQSAAAKPLISSLSVLCRADKPDVRHRKILRSPLIKATAQELDLPLIQTDDLPSWTKTLEPDTYNLIVAVSYGLLIPEVLVKSAKYGGLNVHPSHLPDLRGAAPLVRALMDADRHAGVTLQTLDGRRFDAGRILLQTAKPGLRVPDDADVKAMMALLGPVGAEMVVGYLTGSAKDEWTPTASGVDGGNGAAAAAKGRYAPKVTYADREVRLDATADGILRRDRVMGPLWTMIDADALAGIQSDWYSRRPARKDAPRTTEFKTSRVIFHDWTECPELKDTPEGGSIKQGLFAARPQSVPELYLGTSDGRVLKPTMIKIEGRSKSTNAAATQSLLA